MESKMENRRQATRTCENCEKVYDSWYSRPHRKLCPECRSSAQKELRSQKIQQKIQTVFPSAPLFQLAQGSGLIGAANEMLVCADLISRGYYVFRSVSHACPCDLVAIKDDIHKRIEVRSYNGSSNPGDQAKRIKNRVFEIAAIVAGVGMIAYYDPNGNLAEV